MYQVLVPTTDPSYHQNTMSNLVEAVAAIERCSELELLQLDALIAVRLSLFPPPSLTTKGPTKLVPVPKVTSKKKKKTPPIGNPTPTKRKKGPAPPTKCPTTTVPPPPNGPTSFVYQVKNPFRFSAPMDDSTARSEQET
jgi:hypothetical protein